MRRDEVVLEGHMLGAEAVVCRTLRKIRTRYRRFRSYRWLIRRVLSAGSPAAKGRCAAVWLRAHSRGAEAHAHSGRSDAGL